MDTRTGGDFLEKSNGSEGQKHSPDDTHLHNHELPIHALRLIFDTNNLPWLIQSMDIIRQGFYDTHKCCSLITTGCRECLKNFPLFVKDNLVYRNKVLAIFNNQDIPRHHIALSLFNYKSQALFGNMKFCSSEFSDCFYEDIKNGKYRFRDHKYLSPYSSLYSYHKDDEVIGLYVNGSDLVRRIGIYYLCIKGILNNNIMRVNVYDVFSMYAGGDRNKDVRSVLERLGLGKKDDVDRLVFERRE